MPITFFGLTYRREQSIMPLISLRQAGEDSVTSSDPHSQNHRLLSVFPFHNPGIVFFIFFFYRLLIRACFPFPLQLVLLPSIYRFVTVGFSPPHVARAHYRFL